MYTNKCKTVLIIHVYLPQVVVSSPNTSGLSTGIPKLGKESPSVSPTTALKVCACAHGALLHVELYKYTYEYFAHCIHCILL